MATVFRGAARWKPEPRTHIQLRNLPRTVLPSDIRRAILRAKVEGVSDVAVDYARFLPSGRAFLTLTHADYLDHNLHALRNLTLPGIPVFAQASRAPSTAPPIRTRGVKGRSEATERGVVTGNGPHGGLLNSGKNVVLWGLPGKMASDGVKGLLKGLGLADSEGGRYEVAKVGGIEKQYTMFSRFLVRLASVSEAHRLVRLLHMTYLEPETWGQKYQIRARVVY